MKKLLLLGLLAGITVLNNINLPAADKAVTAEKGDKKSSKHVPFHGKLDALDKGAQTIKVGDRVFHVTATTKITKTGRSALLDEALVGDEVGGAYHEGESGQLQLMSLRIGPKPVKEGKKEEAK